MLGIYFRPKENEQIQIYIDSLLNANRIENKKAFYEHITHKKLGASGKIAYPLIEIWENIFGKRYSLINLFLNGTSYKVEAPFLTEIDKIAYLNKYFRDSINCNKLRYPNELFNLISPCPSCRNINRSNIIFSITDNKYCPFCNSFYHAFINSDHEKRKTSIYMLLMENPLNLTRDQIYKAIQLVIGYPLKLTYNSNLFNLYLNTYLRPKEFIEKYNAAYTDEFKKESSFICNDKEYEVIDASNVNIIEFKHINCGTHFCMTPFGFENGFKCPRCVPTDSTDIKQVYSKFKTNEFKDLDNLNPNCGHAKAISLKEIEEDTSIDKVYDFGTIYSKSTINAFNEFTILKTVISNYSWSSFVPNIEAFYPEFICNTSTYEPMVTHLLCNKAFSPITYTPSEISCPYCESLALSDGSYKSFAKLMDYRYKSINKDEEIYVWAKKNNLLTESDGKSYFGNPENLRLVINETDNK